MNTLQVVKPFDPTKPVKVYRNLQKNVWSILQGKVVVAYAERLYLKDVRFHVRAGGRDKVRKTGQKNVHAFVVGTLTNVYEIRDLERKHLKCDDDVLPYFGVTYNPHLDDTFMNEDREEPIYTAPLADLDMDSEMKVMAVFTPEQAEKEWPSKRLF